MLSQETEFYAALQHCQQLQIQWHLSTDLVVPGSMPAGVTRLLEALAACAAGHWIDRSVQRKASNAARHLACLPMCEHSCVHRPCLCLVAQPGARARRPSCHAGLQCCEALILLVMALFYARDKPR
jgi:hypothetical protein